MARWSPSTATPSRLSPSHPIITKTTQVLGLILWLKSAHGVPTARGPVRPMGATAKWWIKFTRKVQIGLRVLELIAGVGLLGMMILLTKVDPITSWVLRITVSRIGTLMLAPSSPAVSFD